jgi:pilus assembly protein CpaD
MTVMTRFYRFLALGLIGAAASGCTNPMTNGPDQAVDIAKTYPITVEPQVATLVVQVDDGLQTLARGEETRVQAFVERWKMRGQGVLNAAAPSGTPNQAAAMAALDELKKVLAASGIDKNSVQFTSYRAASGDAQAPITLSFVTYAATALECGKNWTESLSYTPRNMPWPEFGCSSQHNFAAIVSDPRDLIEPRTSDPVDSLRRSTVLERYRAGEPTRTVDELQKDSGNVSTVGAK